jgi:hypothetical protein
MWPQKTGLCVCCCRLIENAPHSPPQPPPPTNTQTIFLSNHPEAKSRTHTHVRPSHKGRTVAFLDVSLSFPNLPPFLCFACPPNPPLQTGYGPLSSPLFHPPPPQPPTLHLQTIQWPSTHDDTHAHTPHTTAPATHSHTTTNRYMLPPPIPPLLHPTYDPSAGLPPPLPPPLRLSPSGASPPRIGATKAESARASSAESSESRRLCVEGGCCCGGWWWCCPPPPMVSAAMAAVGGGRGSRVMGAGGLEEEEEAWEGVGEGGCCCRCWGGCWGVGCVWVVSGEMGSRNDVCI